MSETPSSRPAAPEDITVVLEHLAAGDLDAFDRLLALVHGELRTIAAHAMRAERADHTLQPTALVNELYVKLVGQSQLQWESRAHFFGAAARAMRQILVDHARGVGRQKRGGQWQRQELEPLAGPADSLGGKIVDLLSLDTALTRLQEVDPRRGRVVELRYFGGLSSEETARLLDVSVRTVDRDCRFAEAWLAREILPDEPSEES